VGEHRDSIPEGAGRPASRRTSSTVDVLTPRHLPSKGTVVTVAPMAKKDDAVSKRLAEEIALAKRITDGIKNNPPSPGLLDLATPDQRDELAASLWLNEKDPFFGPVSRAFKAFGLDHRNHRDWYRLVACLARVLFPIRRPGGPRKKWTAERLFLLLAQVASYKRERPKASDPAICSWLEKKSYADANSRALRRALHDARNPKRNSELAQLADGIARKANWTTVKAVSWVIENADLLWYEFYRLRK
jgi:hypothetical protein